MTIISCQIVLLSIAILVLTKIILAYANKNKSKNLPPSPPALPFVGHLHLLKKPLHQTLARISEQYGSITYLRFGTRPVLVVSSRSLAEQCFTTHDMAFADRTHLPSVKHVTFDYHHIGAANYGPHWRNVRQIAATEVLSAQRLHASSDVRVGEVRDMARRLFQPWNNASMPSKGSDYFEKVDLKTKLFELSLNVMMTMIAGKRFYGENVEDLEQTKRFREAVEEFFSLSGASNAEDFLPILRMLGMGGAAKKLNHLAELNKEMTQKLIDEHRKARAEKKKTMMITNLLELQKENPEKYSDETIQVIAVSLLQAGTDTSSNSVEWAMTLLLNNPQVLKKAVAEIDAHVGSERLIQESDMPNLPYLHCILNEVLRLYPGGPLLVPHQSRENVSLGGYEIPKGTMLLVNAYQIHRDQSLWDEPTKFKPERFEGKPELAKRMIPFGMGRRRCPGEGLAIRKIGLILGTFIQCFDWERIGEEFIDLTEGSGLTLPKAVPLEAMYRPRYAMMKVLSSLST
ncbi:Cytochrome P450 [Rhynchospora pubera]|uniref:Cytochrome P450 n=1 Tax=Rhynchospora pubera TaxID=906938 RepID=A0AAV8DI33_9POAL|nr:Cytochrome P450 [Rhynchospora pubera]